MVISIGHESLRWYVSCDDQSFPRTKMRYALSRNSPRSLVVTPKAPNRRVRPGLSLLRRNGPAGGVTGQTGSKRQTCVTRTLPLTDYSLVQKSSRLATYSAGSPALPPLPPQLQPKARQEVSQVKHALRGTIAHANRTVHTPLTIYPLVRSCPGGLHTALADPLPRYAIRIKKNINRDTNRRNSKIPIHIMGFLIRS